MADRVRRALAYLKVDPPDDGGGVVALSAADSPIIRPLSHGLKVAYLVDEGSHFQYVQHRDLQEALLSEDELHRVAVNNLNEFAREHAQVRSYGRIYVVLAGGHFEASLLLADNLWTQSYAGLSPHGFVAAVPARDILAFGDASSPTVIRELRSVVQRANAGPGKLDHPLTNVILRRSAMGWEPLDA